MINRRPSPEHYASFYKGYVDLADTENIMDTLRSNSLKAIPFLEAIPTDKWIYRYAADKWTPKEMLVHLIDSERIFAYRALRISRGDQTPLSGFDQDKYVPESAANGRDATSIIQEFHLTRQATLALFDNLQDTMWDRVGVASDTPISVRALAFIICGHEIHHFNILRQRYL